MTNNQLVPEADIIIPDEQARFAIIGSGIIGLLTARALAEQGHDVTVLSHEGKPELNKTHSTSAIAIGQFLPWVPQEHQETLLGGLSLQEVTDFSRVFYEGLSGRPHETGVMSVSNLELVNSGSPWPPGLSNIMGATENQLVNPVSLVGPKGEEVEYDTAITFETFSINTRKTIAYLANLAEKLGVRFEKREINLANIGELDGIIINAAGMGANLLDTSVQVSEFKGHTFVIKPKKGHELPREAVSVEDMIMMPREDGTAICGALYLENPKRPIPEGEEADELFTRLNETFNKISTMVDGLEPDLLDNVDILLHSAGYRVELGDGGIRVVPDSQNQRLLHAYGFGGLGWSVGPHFAQKIATMAQDMHRRQRAANDI